MDIGHRTKQLVATVALAGAVTAGTAGVAVAAESDSGVAAEQPAEAVHHRHHARRVLGGVAADTIGIERTELRDALRNGQSIAEVAEANGVDPQTVVDAMLAAVNDHVDQAVANGRISEERGAAIKARAAERLPELVERHLGDGAGT